MRKPPYLSPTQIMLFYQDREEYYLKYLADNKPPRFEQTRPMSIGSGFDAFVKSYLSEKLFNEVREGFERREIFEKQVEKQHHDWAWENAAYVFEAYMKSGALADLMLELETAIQEPQFEFRVEDKIKHETCREGIPLLGLPDIYFKTKEGNVILDWKVNGYCANNAVSPKKGYIMIRDGWDHQFLNPSRGANQSHKNCILERLGPLAYNSAIHLEEVDKTWAIQCLIYLWLLGEPIGTDALAGIEQIVCKPTSSNPLIRCASHRCRISKSFQTDLFEKIKTMWNLIQLGHIFDDMTLEDSKGRQEMLDLVHKAFDGDQEDEKEAWFNENMR